MKNFETFRSEQDLIQRIEELRSSGTRDADLHVVTANPVDNAAFNYADISQDNAEVTLGDRISAFFTGEDPEIVAFDRFNLGDADREAALQAVRNGEYLLFVDGGAASDGFVEGAGVRDQELVDGYAGDPVPDADLAQDNIRRDAKYNENLGTEDESIRLHEERLRVNKEEVEAGQVEVNKDVITERQEVEVPVRREEVTIERRPIDEHEAGDFDATMDEEGTIRVPLHEERVTVDKENVATEEVVIKKNVVEDTKTVGADLRKEEVRVDENIREGVDLDRDASINDPNAFDPVDDPAYKRGMNEADALGEKDVTLNDEPVLRNEEDPFKKDGACNKDEDFRK